MTFSWITKNLIAALLLPPLNGLLLILFGLLLRSTWRRTANLLLWSGFLLLWALAMPAVGNALLRTLEVSPVDLQDAKTAQAIVVMGAGRYRDAPEFAGETTVKSLALERLRYAARLQRITNLPLLTTGGAPEGGEISEAAAMAMSLDKDFSVPTRWQEGTSNNSHENAVFSAAILHPAGIQRIALVTHSWHMPRAIHSFEAAGFTVIPAPTQYVDPHLTVFSFLPESYQNSRFALHEWIGLVWYRLTSGSAGK